MNAFLSIACVHLATADFATVASLSWPKRPNLDRRGCHLLGDAALMTVLRNPQNYQIGKVAIVATFF